LKDRGSLSTLGDSQASVNLKKNTSKDTTVSTMCINKSVTLVEFVTLKLAYPWKQTSVIYH
jgi:hypothetical protein